MAHNRAATVAPITIPAIAPPEMLPEPEPPFLLSDKGIVVSVGMLPVLEVTVVETEVEEKVVVLVNDVALSDNDDEVAAILIRASCGILHLTDSILALELVAQLVRLGQHA